MVFREALLGLLRRPDLLLPLLFGAGLAVAGRWRWPWPRRLRVALLPVMLLVVLYAPITTWALEQWLAWQVPAPLVPSGQEARLAPQPVAVLVGRGPAIAAATTATAARLVQAQVVQAVYVSGDQLSSAEALVRQGVPPALVAGDSCARTTWENASRTAVWLRHHHPGAPVLLITDPWQLPRASLSFRRQGLQVQPLAAAPSLTPHQRNQLAWRETAGTLLYRLQGRI